MFRTGLVVGKFAPLHYGHQTLIEWANNQCEKLILLSYTGRDIPHCDNNTRQDWLDWFYKARENIKCYTIYGPRDDESEDSHREYVARYLVNTLRTTVDAVFTSEDYGNGFAEYLTNYFKTYVNANHTVKHILFDKERKQVPISATQLRNDPKLLRQWCHSYVAKDFPALSIAILGGESSGKTTLANALSKKLGISVAYEFGRELCEDLGGVDNLRFEDYPYIVQNQIERENKIKETENYIICDTTPLTTLWYMYALHGVFGRWKIDLNRYTHTIICDSDFDFVQDGTRMDDKFRKDAQKFYEDWYKQNKTPYLLVKGSVEERVQQVLNYIKM